MPPPWPPESNDCVDTLSEIESTVQDVIAIDDRIKNINITSFFIIKNLKIGHSCGCSSAARSHCSGNAIADFVDSKSHLGSEVC